MAKRFRTRGRASFGRGPFSVSASGSLDPIVNVVALAIGGSLLAWWATGAAATISFGAWLFGFLRKRQEAAQEVADRSDINDNESDVYGGADVPRHKWATDKLIEHWNLLPGDVADGKSGLYGYRPLDKSIRNWDDYVTAKGGAIGVFGIERRLAVDDIGYISLDLVEAVGLKGEAKVGRSASWHLPSGSGIQVWNGAAFVRCDRIIGDARALAVLALLYRSAGRPAFKHVGMWAGGTHGRGHQEGFAIDIHVLSGNDSFNRLINAAYAENCPLQWISHNPQDGDPVWQVRNGKKERTSKSSQDHSTHWHLELPRSYHALALMPVREVTGA